MTSTEYEKTYDKAREVLERGKKTLQKSRDQRKEVEEKMRLQESALRLAVQLSREGFHKEARQLHTLFAQYQTECPWCVEKRPGEEPNVVEVKVPDSHGMCPECFQIVKDEILAKKQRQ